MGIFSISMLIFDGQSSLSFLIPKAALLRCWLRTRGNKNKLARHAQSRSSQLNITYKLQTYILIKIKFFRVSEKERKRSGHSKVCPWCPDAKIQLDDGAKDREGADEEKFFA